MLQRLLWLMWRLCILQPNGVKKVVIHVYLHRGRGWYVTRIRNQELLPCKDVYPCSVEFAHMFQPMFKKSLGSNKIMICLVYILIF